MTSPIRKIPILKRLIPSLKRFYAKTFWTGGCCIKKIDSICYLLKITNVVDRHLAFHGSFEKGQIDYLASLIKEINADYFLDIGANIGLYSLVLSKQFPELKIHSFEPDIKNYDQLRSNILLNNSYSRIQTYPYAVGSEEKIVNFKMLGNGGSSLNDEDKRIGDVNEVKMITIDSFFNTIKYKNIAIKIDVETYELEVINGMHQFLTSNNCIIQIERFEGYTPKALDEVLKNLGYNEVNRIGVDSYYRKLN